MLRLDGGYNLMLGAHAGPTRRAADCHCTDGYNLMDDGYNLMLGAARAPPDEPLAEGGRGRLPREAGSGGQARRKEEGREEGRKGGRR